MHGKRGDDVLIRVPLGTFIRHVQEDGSEVLLADIVEHGQRVRVARGGKGGLGNVHFASSTDQAPRIAEDGRPGEEALLILDLKLIADVGVAGYPNAGKSTLVSMVSRARPKIAGYPFTTLEPVLGVVEVGYQSFVIADIPGIIEGAHRGLGLGLDFLRHIERTKVIIHLIDGNSESIMEDLRSIEEELKAYGSALKDKPRIIAVNKIDLPEVRSRLPRLKRGFKDAGITVYFISAATGEGVEVLIKKTFELVSQESSVVSIASEEKERAEYKVFRPRPLSAKADRGGRKND